MNKALYHITLCIFFLSVCMTSAFAQEVTIVGKVIDAQSKEPLAFATITNSDGSQGAVSNFLGEFSLTLPESSKDQSLITSMLGYQVANTSLKSVSDPLALTIELEQRIILLPEVRISVEQLTALEVVERAIDNIKVNYPTQPYLLEGFTRSHKRECGEYIDLYEAAFELYGLGYQKKSPERIYIQSSRQSNPTAEYRSHVLRNNRNLFISMGHINDVLYRRGSLKTVNNEYEIKNYTMIDDRLVYIIETKHSKYVTHELFIDAQSFAVLKTKMTMTTPEGEDRNLLLNKGNSNDSLDFKVTEISKTIQFEKNGERYFSKYMDWLVEGELTDKATKEFVCDWGFRFETMFDEVAYENVTKPSNERLMRPRGRRDPEPTAYDPEFWMTYPMLEEFPITPQIITDLSRIEPLETQFQQSGK
ncbi:MAG: carboxypeptidase-like regulatory domain-containing protein [Bacteroidota bacterium]